MDLLLSARTSSRKDPAEGAWGNALLAYGVWKYAVQLFSVGLLLGIPLYTEGLGSPIDVLAIMQGIVK